MTLRTDMYLSQYLSFKGILQVYSGLGTSQSIIKHSQHHTTLTQDS